MASVKVMAKLQYDQNSITQLAEHHARQGSTVTLGRKYSGTNNWLVDKSRPQHGGYNKLSIKDMKDLLKKHESDPPSLCLHLYPTYFKFEHEDGFFSYKSQFKDFLTCIKNKELPGDLVDIFNQASCRFYEGCLIVEIHDHRKDKQEHKTKRILMKPTAESIWNDIVLLGEEWGTTWTEAIALEMEAQILVMTEEPLCLDPSIQVTRVSNAIEYTTTPRRLKKKQKWNSVEREQKLAKKAENIKLMTMMDSRAKRAFPFEPSFGKISFVQDWRVKKQKMASEPLPAIDIKKGKGRKTLSELPVMSDGRKCVRTIRFERSESDKKVHTIVNIYIYNGEYDGVFRWGTVYDTSLNGGNIDFSLGPEYLMETYIVHLKTTYGQFNKLICDNTDTNTSTPASPSNRLPVSMQQGQQVPATQAQTKSYQLQQLQAQHSRILQEKMTANLQNQRAAFAQAQAQNTSQAQNQSQPQNQVPALSQPQAQVQTKTQTQAQSQTQTQAQAQALAQTQSQTQAHLQQLQQSQARNMSPAQSQVGTPTQSQTQTPTQAASIPLNGMKNQQQIPLQNQPQITAQTLAALQKQQQAAMAASQNATLPNTSALPNNNATAAAVATAATTATASPINNGNMMNGQQAVANMLNAGGQQINPQVAIQRIQQLVQAGAIPLATAQQWVSQLANSGNLQRPNQAATNQQAPAQRPAVNAQGNPQANAVSELFAQLSPQHRQQMATIVMRRNQLLQLAQQRNITQEELQAQLRQLQQFQQIILQQHQQQRQQQQSPQTQPQQVQQPQVLQQVQQPQVQQPQVPSPQPQQGQNRQQTQSQTPQQQSQALPQQSQHPTQPLAQQTPTQAPMQTQQQQQQIRATTASSGVRTPQVPAQQVPAQQGMVNNGQFNAQNNAMYHLMMQKSLQAARGLGRGQVPFNNLQQQLQNMTGQRSNAAVAALQGMLRNNNNGGAAAASAHDLNRAILAGINRERAVLAAAAAAQGGANGNNNNPIQNNLLSQQNLQQLQLNLQLQQQQANQQQQQQRNNMMNFQQANNNN